MTFEKATYNVSENDTAQIVLILSKPSSANVSVEVFDANTTALGEMQLYGLIIYINNYVTIAVY